MKHKNITVIVFLGILCLFFAAGVLLPEQKFSESENRYLAGKPEFTMKRLLDGSFGEAYETYLSDQFPLRNTFVAAKTNVERLLLKEDVNGVYFGKKHYYIEKFEPEILMTEQLDRNLNFLSQAAGQFAKQLGEDRVKIMLVPSASQILTDKLPLFAAPADQGMVTEKLKNSLIFPEQLLQVEELLSSHREEALYYKTDHHWTTRGAFLGFQLYCEAAGLKVLEESEFTKETVTKDFYGTIESKIKVSMVPDEITLYLPKMEQEYRVYYDGLPKEYDTLYNEKALEGKDKYALFLDGNHGLTRIVNETAKESGNLKDRKLLIIKDSYAHSFAPFAAAEFPEVIMVDLRYFNMSLSEFISAQGITDLLVLYQIPGFAADKNIFKMVR